MEARAAIKARIYIRTAIKNGDLDKPYICPICGKRFKNRQFIHAHHPNGYSDPADFQWVCHWCHMLLHAGATPPFPKNKAWCVDCGKFLPKRKFNKDSTRYDGLRKYCKKCQSINKSIYLLKQKILTM